MCLCIGTKDNDESAFEEWSLKSPTHSKILKWSSLQTALNAHNQQSKPFIPQLKICLSVISIFLSLCNFEWYTCTATKFA